MVTVVTAVIFRPLMIKYPTERENLKVASQSTLNSQTIYSMTFTINHNYRRTEVIRASERSSPPFHTQSQPYHSIQHILYSPT